ncbi:uncharacterized protein LOC143294872 [Babylonia areolata]|uniref:uncharacterized protein LOC143294872 n=1 Tax=Babylonia areolata TaxID=304850 RepID=UPI003FCFBEA7
MSPISVSKRSLKSSIAVKKTTCMNLHGEQSRVGCHRSASIADTFTNMLTIHSDIDSSKMDLRCDNDSSKMDVHSDNDGSKMHLHSDNDGSKKDLQKDSIKVSCSSCDSGLDSHSASDTSKMDLHSNNGSSKADSHSDYERSKVDPHSDSDGSTTDMLGSKINVHMDSDFEQSETNSRQADEVDSVMETSRQQFDTDRTLQSPQSEAHLLSLVDTLFEPSFIAELQHQVEQASGETDDVVSFMPADQLSPSLHLPQMDEGLLSFVDFTASKEDIEDDLLMPHIEDQNSRDLPSPSLLVHMMDSTITPSLHTSATHYIPSCSPALVPHYSGGAGDFYDPMHHSLVDNASSSGLSVVAPAVEKQVGSPDSLGVEPKGIQVGDAHQAVIPDLMSPEDYDNDPHPNTGTTIWSPAMAEGKDVHAYLREASTIKRQGRDKMGLAGSVRRAEDEEALEVLHQQGYNRDRALGCLRQRSLWSHSPMDLWSEEECQRFVAGFMLHKKNFYLVQQVVMTRTLMEVVHFYYLWKHDRRFGSYEDKKKLANSVYLSAATRLKEDQLDDEALSEVSPWKQTRRERSTSPVRSLINSRHKTPPPVLDLQDPRPSPAPTTATTTATTPVVSPTETTATAHAVSPTATTTATAPVVSPTATTPAVSPTATTTATAPVVSQTDANTPSTGCVPDTFATPADQHGASLSSVADLCGLKQSADTGSLTDNSTDLYGVGHMTSPARKCSLTSADSSSLSDSKCDANSSSSSSDSSSAQVSDCECSASSSSSSSSDKPERCPKCVFSEFSSDSSDTSRANSRRSRKRGRSREDLDRFAFRGIFHDIKRIKRCTLSTSPQGSGRSDVYNSDSESCDSDMSEEALSHRHTVSQFQTYDTSSSLFYCSSDDLS